MILQSTHQTNKKDTQRVSFLLVGEDGFEPSKSVTTDLQSAPFGRSGTLPYIQFLLIRLKLHKMELVDGLEPPTC